MLGRLIICRLKVLLRNRSLIFWTLIFPIVLGLFFKLVFNNLDQAAMLTTKTPIAVVGNNQDSQYLTQILTQAKSQQHHLYRVHHLTSMQANQSLNNDKIVGYYDTRTNPVKLIVVNNSEQQAILRSILSQYEQNRTLTMNLLKSGQISAAHLASEMPKQPQRHYTQNIAQGRKFDSMSFYFFTLVAMTIGFGFSFGIKNANDEQANQSANGIRINLTPTSKLMMITSNLIAALIVLYSIILLVLAVFHFGYQIDFGHRWGAILGVCFIGSALQICLGKFLGNILAQKNYSQKLGFGYFIIIILSMLAGMMGTQDIKYWIDIHLPLLGKLNTVNLISDSLYQLFFYQSLQPFYQNLYWLMGLSIILIIIDYLLERRSQYVSL
ncbi:MAG: ABC transporter permease [Lactobacillus sp.]|nr:ABC transporter permease [Lactobacillus sp.]